MTPPSPHHSTIDAAVLGCWENGYGVSRQLAHAGLRVAGVYAKGGEVWRHSRYLADRAQAPDPAKDPAPFIEFLLAQAPRWRGALLIPTNDHYLDALSRNKAKLAAHYVVLAADAPVVANLIDKSGLYATAQAIGVPAPRTGHYDSLAALAADLPRLKFPCLLKPMEGHRFFEAFGQKLFVTDHPDQLVGRFRDAHAKGLKVGVQELIPGPITDLYSYYSYRAEDRTILFESVWRKLRQAPPHFGVGRAMHTEWQPEVAEHGRRLLDALGYTGVCQLEFKRDQRDGRWVVLDANGRFPLPNILFHQAGVNLPHLVYLDRVKGERGQPQRPRDGVYWINLNEDIRHTFLMPRQEPLTVGGWLLPYRREHVFQDFDPTDPWPFCLRMGIVLRRTGERIARKLLGR
jgi:predicted ATP-grasp superfamily ATP-dependent carboligase